MRILFKRVLRGIKTHFGRNLVLFLLLATMISVTSGFLVASDSTAGRNNNLMTDGKVEDGQFTLTLPMSKDIESKLEKEPINFEKMYRVDVKIDDDKTIRLYSNRSKINLPIIREGRLAKSDDEIALNIVFAQSEKYKIGNYIDVDGKYFADNKSRRLKIVGYYVSPDYNASFEKNNDFIFDNINFGIGLVSESLAKKFSKNKVKYQVSYRFNDPKLRSEYSKTIGERKLEISKSDRERKEELEKDIYRDARSEKTLMEALRSEENKSISYMMDDMGGDRPMMMVISVMMIMLIAFLFAVASASGIQEESEIIGTLLASGYRKREILAYYMMTPVLVTFVAAVCGNILGYTYFAKIYSGMYYRSFNLPEFKSVFNSEALIITTVMPIVVMLLINYLYLVRKLKHSPMEFLRHALSKKKKRKNRNLKVGGFFNRFRLRVIISSIGDYLVMVVGIFLISMLIYYGFAVGPTLDRFENISSEGLVSKYQYILKTPVELNSQNDVDRIIAKKKRLKQAVDRGIVKADDKTETFLKAENPKANAEKTINQAEKMTVSAGDVYMKIRKSYEEVSIYGISKDSRYFKDLKLSKDDDGVVVSHGLAKKAQKKIGDTLTIKNKVTGKKQKYKIVDIYRYEPALTAFFSREKANDVIDEKEDYFNAYLSDEKLHIDDMYVATVVDKTSVSEVTKTLKNIMGPMLDIFLYSSLIFFFAFMFLLTKTVINKSRLSIAYLKILGYRNREINLIYIRPNTIILLLTFLIGWPIHKKLMDWISFVAFSKFAGYFEMEITNIMFLKAFGAAILVYIIVCLSQMYRISKMNYGEALKNRE